MPTDAAAALREYAAIVPTLPRSIGWHAALKHDVPALPFVPAELVGERLLMLISMWLDDADDPAGFVGDEHVAALDRGGQPRVVVGRDFAPEPLHVRREGRAQHAVGVEVVGRPRQPEGEVHAAQHSPAPRARHWRWRVFSCRSMDAFCGGEPSFPGTHGTER